MFWSDYHFEPADGWQQVQPLFEASRDAWKQGGDEAGLAADDAIHEAGLTLVPLDGGERLTDFLLRINGSEARLRY